MLDAAALTAALPRWCAAMHDAMAELNALDGRLGDADLGVTLDKCATLVEQALPDMPDTLEGVFKRCAQATAKASGSSFGTLLTVALMTGAKRCAGTTSLGRTDLAELLTDIVHVLSARGGAALGDKTVLAQPHGARPHVCRQDHRPGRPRHGRLATHGGRCLIGQYPGQGPGRSCVEDQTTQIDL